MKVLKEKFIGGWFIGDFTPSIFRTKDFEVCYKIHEQNEKWPQHYHKVATEINYLMRGRMTVQGRELVAGDVFSFEPNEVADPVFTEKCELIVVKFPSVKGDKYDINCLANTLYRTNCVICNGNLVDMHTLPNFPIYMGVNYDDIVQQMCDLTYCRCETCNTLQVRKLIPLDVLYKHNHNTDVVGDMWKNHYASFSKFIFDDEQPVPKTILEVGDPSCKMANANRSKKFEEWIIIEPSKLINGFDRVRHIQNVLDNTFTIDPVDMVIFSHSFEHMYNPSEIAQKLHDIITEDGCLYVSIPDMNHFAEHELLPFNCVTFEHTFFINPDIMEYLFQNKFKLEKVEYYKHHSVFLKFRKQSATKTPINSKTSRIGETNKHYNRLFVKNTQTISDYIAAVNKKLETVESYYIYGAHISTQFLLQVGINPSKIVGILDNAQSKIGKTLYGTNYRVYSPQILTHGAPVVMCKVGAFTDEIKADLLKINNRITFL